MLPDGTFLDGDLHDSVVVEGSGVGGRTLADVARVVPTEGMWDDTMPSILGRIAVRTDDELAVHEPTDDDAWVAVVDDGAGPGCAWYPDDGGALVSTGGRFAMGPLDGRTAGTEVRFVGAAARERARAAALAELEARLAELDAQLAATAAALEAARARRRRFDQELDAFPSAAEVVRGRAVARAAAGRLDDARDHLNAADRSLATARDQMAAARARLDSVALEVGLAAHVARLGELAADSRAWREVAVAWIAALERWLDQRQLSTGVASRLDVVRRRVDRDQEEADRATAERDRLASRVATLDQMVGAEADDIREQVRGAAADHEGHERERQRLDERRAPVFERVGSPRARWHMPRTHTNRHWRSGTRPRLPTWRWSTSVLDVLAARDVTVDDDPHTWGCERRWTMPARSSRSAPTCPTMPRNSRPGSRRSRIGSTVGSNASA